MNSYVCLTFDIDWASDEILQDTVGILEKYNCKATFFTTHKSELIDKLASSDNFEVGLHPNFNFLLDNKSELSVKEILIELKKYYPLATSIRSHSLVNGTSISKYYSELGITIDSNFYIPFSSIKELNSWKFWNNVKVMPFIWSDYIDQVQMKKDNLLELLKSNILVKTVAFHPIHIYINTASIDDYEKYKKDNQYKNTEKYGVKDTLISFLEEIQRQNLTTITLKEAV